ncbi:hypothetical protein GF354_03330 [Candidatus Peregrinibacteria bacterium]|nr:hypothetical protein [Candidatus Peregrinibacteria bacterium]
MKPKAAPSAICEGNIMKNIYFLNEFWNIPAEPGIYCWRIQFNRNMDLLNYHKLFKQKRFDVKLKGNFQDYYKGKVQAEALKKIDKTIMQFPMDKLDLIEKATKLFCPPLYIGISNSLYHRLEIHSDQLQRKLFSNKEKNSFDSNQINPDTDEESTYFGERLGAALKKLNEITMSVIYVQIILAEKKFEIESLKTIEYYLNRTYAPLFGRL